MDSLAALLHASARPAAAGLRWVHANPSEAAALASWPMPTDLGYAAATSWLFLQERCRADAAQPMLAEPASMHVRERLRDIEPEPAAGVTLWRPVLTKVALADAAHSARPARSTAGAAPPADHQQEPKQKRARVDQSTINEPQEIISYLQAASAVAAKGTTAGDNSNLFVLVGNMAEDVDVDRAFATVCREGFADDLVLHVLGDFVAVGSELSHSICSRFMCLRFLARG